MIKKYLKKYEIYLPFIFLIISFGFLLLTDFSKPIYKTEFKTWNEVRFGENNIFNDFEKDNKEICKHIKCYEEIILIQ